MKTNTIIELVILIDRSLSIRGREKNIYDLYQKLITKYHSGSCKCFITLGLFSDDVEFYYSHSDISHTKAVPLKEFYADGSTSLYDAVKMILKCADENLQYLQEGCDQQSYLYVITDGLDNSSAYYEETGFMEEMKSREDAGWILCFMDPKGQIVYQTGM